MGKPVSYFPHDDNARNDEKLLLLRKKFGLSGIGIYWGVLEVLSQSPEGFISRESLMLQAPSIGTQGRWMAVWIDYASTIDLIKSDHRGLFSERMLEHKKHRKLLSEKGKEGAERRWEGHSHPISLPNSHPNASKVKESKGKETYTKEFDQFWSVYPRREGKGLAYSSFRRLSLEDGLLDKIISAVEIQKRSDQWTKDGGQYIPMPATWLNQRRWEDEGIQVQSKKKVGPRFVGISEEMYGKV